MAKTKQKYRRNSGNATTKTLGLAARVALVEKAVVRSDMPKFKAGDTVRVHVKIKEGEKERIQPYEGVVIGRSNTRGGKSFVVRKISHGVGVARIFMESSPKVAKVELVQEGKVRRAKLYYIRGLEGKAAKIEREVETLAAAAASAARQSPSTRPRRCARSRSSPGLAGGRRGPGRPRSISGRQTASPESGRGPKREPDSRRRSAPRSWTVRALPGS